LSEIMTIEELAKYLKISKSSMYKLCQEGKVPGHKVGRHWRFQREIIDRWLAEQSAYPRLGSVSMKELRAIVDRAISMRDRGDPLEDDILGRIVDDVVGGDER